MDLRCASARPGLAVLSAFDPYRSWTSSGVEGVDDRTAQRENRPGRVALVETQLNRASAAVDLTVW